MNNKQKLGPTPYIIGALSFLPGIGVMLGIIAIIWGLETKKKGGKIVASLGIAGNLLTLLTIVALSQIGKEESRKETIRVITAAKLEDLIGILEEVKLNDGKYPMSLQDLVTENPSISLEDIEDNTQFRYGEKPKFFYYENLSPDHYYLLGVGDDGIPFTEDDMIPKKSFNQGRIIGLKTSQ